MRKPTFHICESKGADQLRSTCEADQHFCFRYTDRIVQFLFFLNLKFSISSHLFCLYSSFRVRPVRKPHCWFSHNAAQIWLLAYISAEADLQLCFPCQNSYISSVLDSEFLCYAPRYMSCILRKPDFIYAKSKAQISFTVTAKLNCEADQCLCFCYTVAQFLFILNPKFQASSHLL